ncbi:MAG: hypothetical protein AB3N33_12245 [Puniceicoccaceae bacterium]
MVPIAAIKYLFLSAILVVSLFLSIRCLFASDVRREAWRFAIKHRYYMRQKTFKRVTLLLGGLLLVLALLVAYYLTLDLLED